jgi:thioredoxin-related protein
MLDIQKNSPSNIKTVWKQRYYYHIKKDNMLKSLVIIFRKNGNCWNMKKDLFDQIVIKENLKESLYFDRIYAEVLEIDGDFIHFSQYVADYLLENNWKFSFRNLLKRLRNAVSIRNLLKRLKNVISIK